MGDTPKTRLERVVNEMVEPCFGIRLLGEYEPDRQIIWDTTREDDGIFTTELPCISGHRMVITHETNGAAHQLSIELLTGDESLAWVLFRVSAGVVVPEAKLQGNGRNPRLVLDRMSRKIDTARCWVDGRWWQ